MPKEAKKLGDAQVKALRLDDGQTHAMVAVGGVVSGLALQLTRKRDGTGTTRSWLLRIMRDGRRHTIGLGAYPLVPLGAARKKAEELVLGIKHQGTDPEAQKKRARRATDPLAIRKTPTLEQAFAAYIETHKAGWKSKVHLGQWENDPERLIPAAILARPVAAVTKADVLQTVEPLWTAKHSTAVKLRGKLEMVLDWAVARGMRPEGSNPAALKGLGLVKAKNLRKTQPVEHHSALPWEEMPAFMQRLRNAEGMGARALEFTVYTAARSGEARGATWDEIDLEAKTWAVPAQRMKAGKEHRVPLSDAAVSLLKALPRIEGEALVFPSTKRGKPLSDMTLTAVLKRMKVEATAHGMRSSFRDWGTNTDRNREHLELALAHAVGDGTVQAYARTDALEARRPLMQAWADFCAKGREHPRTGGPKLSEGPAL